MLVRLFFAAILYGLFVFGTPAQNRSLALVGAGAVSCQEILDDSKNERLKDMAVFWMQGFLSGMNHIRRSSEKVFVELGSLTSEAHMEIVLSKCKQKPSQPFFVAILRLVDMLEVKRVTPK